jgi:hypothetical protein
VAAKGLLNFLYSTTITFNGVGQSVTFVHLAGAGKSKILNNNGATIT